MFKTFLFVFIGGGLGSILRYSIQKFTASTQFPYATLSINIIGCFIAGLLFTVMIRNNSGEQLRAMLIAGFCGGFTTFSAFSLESVQLYKQNIVQFVLYVALSLIICLAATVLGMKIIK